MATYIAKPVTIDFTSDRPPPGSAVQMNFRVKKKDKDMVDRAVLLLGMNQADYLRHTVILAARGVVEQAKEQRAVLDGEDTSFDNEPEASSVAE